MNRTEIFTQLTQRAADTYKAKNHDYGNSFAKVREKFPDSILIRLNDKLNRLEVLMGGEQAMVKDESIDDTLLDLANYALMELTERIYEREQEEAKRCKAGTCVAHNSPPVADDESAIFAEFVGNCVLGDLGVGADDGIRIERISDEAIRVSKHKRGGQ